MVTYMHIGVGSALLVQLYRAMREPLEVGRVTGTVSHAFFVSWFLELNITNTGKGSTGKNQECHANEKTSATILNLFIRGNPRHSPRTTKTKIRHCKIRAQPIGRNSL